MARVKVVTEEELPEGAAPDEAVSGVRAFSTVDSTLFPNAGVDPKKVPGGVGVTRIDPPDGYIGHFPPGTTKEDLKRLVGGYMLSLDLKDGLGQVIPGCKGITLRIDAPPVPSAEAKARAGELRKGGIAADGDILERVMAVQRTAVEQLKQQSNDHAAMLRAELEASSRRRQEEAEASLARMRTEAQIRAEEADAKHKRELELQRAYTDAQLTREREQRALEKAQHTEMIGMIQNNSARQTEIVVASLQNKTDAMGVIKEMMTLAAPLLPLLSGQGDPAVEITKAVSTSLESMTRLVTTDKPAPGANGAQNPKSNGGATNGKGTQNVKAVPELNAADKKTRLIAKVGKLLQAVHGAGQDPEAILDGAIKHYEAQGGEEGAIDGEGEEVEEPREPRQTRGHAAKRSRRSAKRRADAAPVARRGGAKPARPAKSAVGRRAAPHGRPAPKSSARGDAARGKRNRKA
jgi:hypothetical protein